MPKNDLLEDMLKFHEDAVATLRKAIALTTNGASSHVVTTETKPRGSEPRVVVRRRKRSRMSPAMRRAVSVRMKKYWAARRRERAEA